MRRSSVRCRRRGPPRRGRIIDRAYLVWLHTQPGIVEGGPCHSVHHVRWFGSPKKDCDAVPLEFGYHQLYEGKQSIEALGKEEFQSLHGIVLTEEIARLQQKYKNEHPKAKVNW